MQERLNDLGFIIGAFFTVVAIILFANNIINKQEDLLSVYTARGFIIFGLAMMFARKKKQ